MNVSDLQTYNQAVSLANAGNTEQAHTLLVQLRQNNPADANVLVWFAYTTRDINVARDAIARAAQAEPNNPAVTPAQNWLAQWEQQQQLAGGSTGWPSIPAVSSPEDEIVWPSSKPIVSSQEERWPAPTTSVYSAIVYQQPIRPVAQPSGCGTKILIWSLSICVGFIFLMMALGLIFGDNFDKSDGQALLEQFMQAAAAGDVDSASSKVLPSITKDSLKTTFLDPNSGTLQNYASLQNLTFTFYSASGGKSLIIKGFISYKKLGSSVFKANLQRTDSDGKWYIASLTIAPLNQIVVLS